MSKTTAGILNKLEAMLKTPPAHGSLLLEVVFRDSIPVRLVANCCESEQLLSNAGADESQKSFTERQKRQVM
jgi:hypothetical protein